MKRVVRFAFQEFGDVTACPAHSRRKAGRVLKAILYGSFGRGGSVPRQHTTQGYKSDFNLLLIINYMDTTGRVDYRSWLDDRLVRQYASTGTLKTPINFIGTHLAGERGLAEGHYLFIDVAKDGMRHVRPTTKLHSSKHRTPAEAQAMANALFYEWMRSTLQHLATAKFTAERGWHRRAAFFLHQSAECLSRSISRAATFQTPSDYNLGFLRAPAERTMAGLPAPGLPSGTRKQRATLDKLKGQYSALVKPTPLPERNSHNR